MKLNKLHLISGLGLGLGLILSKYLNYVSNKYIEKCEDNEKVIQLDEIPDILEESNNLQKNSDTKIINIENNKDDEINQDLYLDEASVNEFINNYLDESNTEETILETKSIDKHL